MAPPRSLTARRMGAYWVVLTAAALTTLVAAALATALAVFAGQALPLALRHDLAAAPGTSLILSGAVGPHQAAPDNAALAGVIRSTLHQVPFSFYQADWSDPLGLVAGSRPARPASAEAENIPLIQAGSLSGITTRAVLLAGHWPTAPSAATAPGGAGRTGSTRPGSAGPVIPAALPASVAALLHLSPGDVVQLRDRIDGQLIRFRLTGVFAPRRLSGPAASYWGLNIVGPAGVSTAGGFTTYGPLVVSPSAFTGPLNLDLGSWVAQPQMARFSDANLTAIAGDVSALRQSLQNSPTLGGLQLTTGLPTVLGEAASDLAVARSLLVIGALQLLLLTAAALLATAGLLASQREAESALLTARGATRWQLTRLTAAELIPLCAAAGAAGGLAGAWLAGLLADSGPLRAARLQLPGTWFGSPDLAPLWAVLATAAGAVLLMVLPSLRKVTPGAVRVSQGRQDTIAGATRAGADIALVALAVLAGWQLRRYSAAATSGNGTAASIDPVLAVAPALALAGGTVATLRLLPALARTGDWLAARGRKLTAAMAGWQVSRQPVRQGGAALLIVMAVATATLALAQHESWTRSARDQAAFTAGADVRVDMPAQPAPDAVGSLVTSAGVQHAAAVSVQANSTPAEVLAIDARQAASVTWLRPDQSPLPAAALFGKIEPPGTPGVVLPGHPANVTLSATLGPPTVGLAPAQVSVTVMDTSGDTYQLAAGTLPADGRPHLLTAVIGQHGRAIYPLRLTAITIGYVLPARATAAAVLQVRGPALSGWAASASSPELVSVRQASDAADGSHLPAAMSWRPGRDGTSALTFSPGYGESAVVTSTGATGTPVPIDGQLMLSASQPRPTTIPGIATSAFLGSSGATVGSTVQETIGGLDVPVRIVAAVSNFPTVTASNGALIVDLAALQNLLTLESVAPAQVTEWWLATAGHRVPPGLAARLPSGSAITSAAQLTDALTSDPLSAAPQQALLALAAAAALVAVTGFCVAIAADVRQRRAETALMAALGVTPGGAARQLALEKLLLSLPAAALGLVLGAVVARLLVPAVTLTTAAAEPVPPPLTMLDPGQTVPLALAIAVLPAIAAALAMTRRPDPAAELRAAEAA
jgi:FtsX-like permease family